MTETAANKFCAACGTPMGPHAAACPKCAEPCADAKPKAPVGWGWFLGFLIPIIGLIIGIVVITRGRTGMGVAIIIWSILNIWIDMTIIALLIGSATV